MPTTSVGQWVMLNCSVVTPGRTVTQAQAPADRQTEGEASRDTCHHAPTTTTARILAERVGYVPVKVSAAVLLAGDDGRDQVEVRGVGQLDDSCAAPAAHAGCTRRRPGRRDSGGALPVRWSVGYPDRPRMPAAGLRRPPSRSARTTWPLWGSSLRAPSVAGDLPPPHRRTGFPQPPATLLPPNHARQACGPAARPARRSAAPRQQQQPGLRAASSSSAERGQIRRPIFVP